MTPDLDIQFVRSQFPAFAEPSLSSQAFFENAGGSYTCTQVINHLCNYYRKSKVQPYGVYAASIQAGEEMDLAHQRLAEYLNVDETEVHLGPSTSQNTYVLAQAFANQLQAGDEIVVTNQDHEANSGVWRRLSDLGITVKEWQVDPVTGILNIQQLDELLTDSTRLLMFPHCSNIVAHINPVSDICAKAKQAGVTTIVDGVSYAGHGIPDVDALAADVYLFSLYKTFGPHLGVMVIRQPIAELLGNQAHYFNGDYIHKWFVPAGPDHAQIAASRGVAEYFDQLHAHHFSATTSTQLKAQQVRDLLRQSEKPLLAQLLDFAQQHPRIKLAGPADPERRAATVSLLPVSQTPLALATALAGKGIMAGASHFYAVRLLEAMNIDPLQGVLRLSFVHYTSQQEIERLLSALDEVL
jgi:selenocysteine lyase/cysteine desulfurase